MPRDMGDRPYPDLDFRFLRYTGVVSEEMRRIQSFYLPFFEGRQRVLDLACGDGDFVEMLTEQGILATGIDFDPNACEAMQTRGLDVVCQDVLEYLEQVEPESIDGIFSAHLVEHLTYRQTLRMLELSLRVLKPGGVILLVTPNVRSMYAHLESFYKHFGHVSFYHPELLCFFFDYVGFVDPQMGENPRMAKPLWGELSISERLHIDTQYYTGRQSQVAQRCDRRHHDRRYRGNSRAIPRLTYERMLPLSRDNRLQRAIRGVKMFLVRMIVQPYIDQLVTGINQLLTEMCQRIAADLEGLAADADQLAGEVNAVVADISRLAHEAGTRFREVAYLENQVRETLDRPVECYAYAYKATDEPATAGCESG